MSYPYNYKCYSTYRHDHQLQVCISVLFPLSSTWYTTRSFHISSAEIGMWTLKTRCRFWRPAEEILREIRLLRIYAAKHWNFNIVRIRESAYAALFFRTPFCPAIVLLTHAVSVLGIPVPFIATSFVYRICTSWVVIYEHIFCLLFCVLVGRSFMKSRKIFMR